MASPRDTNTTASHTLLYFAAAGVATAAALFVFTPDHLLPGALAQLKRRMGCCSSSDATRGADAGIMPASEPLAADTTGVPQADTPPSAPLQDPAAAHAEWLERLLESVRDARTGASKSPATVLTQALWSAIEGNAIPPHVAGRRLRSVFTTEAQGYNPDAMHRQCDAQRERLKDGQDGFCVLLVRTGDLVVGAVLNVLPEWHTKGRRTYIGGPATTVFVCGTDGSELAVYRAADEGNGRFFRADNNALMVGAGSDGAAIRVDAGLTEVQCSPCGSTFAGLESASLLDSALAAGAAGLHKDVGGVRGKVSTLELLLVTEAVI